MPLFIAVLSFISVMCLGGAVISLLSTRRRLVRERVKFLTSQAAGEEPAPPPARGPITEALVEVGRRSSAGKQASRPLRLALAQAGFGQPSAPSVYLGVKMIFLVVSFMIMMLAQALIHLPLPTAVPIVIVVVGLFFFAPNAVVGVRRRSYMTEVRHHLPDAVDLLEICVSSGMNLDLAWNLVTDEIRHVSRRLADEMALTNMEMHLGMTRAEAMRHMAERTGAEELGSLVAVLVQSDRFGTSISEVLRVFAATMRELRSQRAEEAAEKMAVKLLFPMIIFIFPSIMIVTAGPAGIAIAQVLGQN